MRERSPDEAGGGGARRSRGQLAAELQALRELNRRRGELLANAVREAQVPLQTLRRFGDLLALPAPSAERVQDVAAEVHRAAMQLENLLVDLEHAAHLPRPLIAPSEPLLQGDGEETELRARLETELQRSAALESQLAAAHLAQQQLQSYADDFRRIYAESRQRLQQMAALYEVSTAIGATVDPQEVLDRTAEGLTRLLRNADLVIYLLEDGGPVVVRRMVAGRGGASPAPESARDDELLGRCLATGRAQVASRDRDGDETAGRIWQLAVPLFASSRVLGALVLEQRDGRPFDQEERHLAEMVATQTAMALQNARLATTDALTGLFNRRYFEQALAFECERARRVRRPLGLLIADIDHFKRFNERFGHPAGDAVLREVATTLATQLRRTDIVARIGGEEFAAILPEDDMPAVEVAAERLRQAVERRPTLRFEGRDLPPVRISVGGASLAGEAVDAADLIRAADDALRRAKRGGRNRSLVVGNAAGAARRPSEQAGNEPREHREARP